MQDVMTTCIGFLLIVFRCAALFMTAPLFGTKSVPAKVRMAIAFAVSVVAFIAAGGPKFAAWEQPVALLTGAVSETLTGLSVGLAARLVLEAANAAGHIIALSTGLGFANVMDPLHGSESSALNELLAMGALLTAVGMGIHRDAIAWLCRSVIEMPPGTMMSVGDVAARVINAGVKSAAMSVRLGFPVMAAVTFGHIALGLAGRLAPQINLQSIGFSVAVLAGGASIYVTAPAIAEIVARTAQAALVTR
jgi:flagellar biosynthesis protein FliR